MHFQWLKCYMICHVLWMSSSLFAYWDIDLKFKHKNTDEEITETIEITRDYEYRDGGIYFGFFPELHGLDVDMEVDCDDEVRVNTFVGFEAAVESQKLECPIDREEDCYIKAKIRYRY